MLPLKRFGLTILEFFLPRLCLFCGTAVGAAAEMAVCPECAGKIEWVASPVCSCCGLVFESREGGDRLCGDCQMDPPPFRRARAALVYDFDGPVGSAIKRFKFGRQLAYLPVLHSWLRSPACRELAAAADLIAPVPLFSRRLKMRGFNQSLLLAQAFPAITLTRELLLRIKETRPQVDLKFKDRQANVQGAFAVADRARVKGKNILLIDDIYTSGATVKECARVLKKAGAAQVEVLTVARRVRSKEDDQAKKD
jgi:ComF family protein